MYVRCLRKISAAKTKNCCLQRLNIKQANLSSMKYEIGVTMPFFATTVYGSERQYFYKFESIDFNYQFAKDSRNFASLNKIINIQ